MRSACFAGGTAADVCFAHPDGAELAIALATRHSRGLAVGVDLLTTAVPPAAGSTDRALHLAAGTPCLFDGLVFQPCSQFGDS